MTKKLLLILIPSVLLLSSCESDQPSIIEVDQPSIIEVDQQDLNLTLNDESEKVFSFKTSDSWTVSVTDTSSVEWLSLSHLNGAKGESSIEIKAVPNNSFADRRALLTINSGNSQFSVGVFQEFGNGVTDIDIPDKDFREYCLKNFDANKDGLVSYKEVKNAQTLTFFYSIRAKSLKGIEYFSNLKDLTCNSESLTEIDLSKNTKLISLVFYSPILKRLDLSRNTELTYLHIRNSNLETLDLSKNTELAYLRISNYGSRLEKLDLSNNTKLTELYCSGSSLKELKLENLTELQTLDCYNNSLSTLDLTGNKKILRVFCNMNSKLTEVWIAKDSTPYINKDSHTTVIKK